MRNSSLSFNCVSNNNNTASLPRQSPSLKLENSAMNSRPMKLYPGHHAQHLDQGLFRKVRFPKLVLLLPNLRSPVLAPINRLSTEVTKHIILDRVFQV